MWSRIAYAEKKIPNLFSLRSYCKFPFLCDSLCHSSKVLSCQHHWTTWEFRVGELFPTVCHRNIALLASLACVQSWFWIEIEKKKKWNKANWKGWLMLLQKEITVITMGVTGLHNSYPRVLASSRVWLKRVCLLRICPFCTKWSGDLEIFR